MTALELEQTHGFRLSVVEFLNVGEIRTILRRFRVLLCFSEFIVSFFFTLESLTFEDLLDFG